MPVNHIIGRICNLQDQPIERLTVRAFIEDNKQQRTPIGEALTNAEGSYEINLPDADLRPSMAGRQLAKISVQVYRADTLLGANSQKMDGQQELRIDLKVDVALEATRRIRGTVRNAFGELMSGVTVQALQQALRKEQLLGSAPSENGAFEIRSERAQLNAGKGMAGVILKVVNATGKTLYKSPVHFSLPDDFEVNISLSGTEYKGTSEFDRLTQIITPLLDGVPPTELREDEQFQDLSLLAGETGLDSDKIAAWVISHRLSAKTTREGMAMEPAVFFSFLAQGQPPLMLDDLLEDMKDPAVLALMEEKLLESMAHIKSPLQRSLLEKGAADNLVPTSVLKNLTPVLEHFEKINLANAAEGNIGGGKGTISNLLELVPEAKRRQTAFMSLLTEHHGPMKGFWKKVEEQKVLGKPALDDIEQVFDIGSLTLNHVPMVSTLRHKLRNSELGNIKDLAQYTKEQWKNLFKGRTPDGKPVGVPPNLDGANDEEKMERYATILDRNFERRYPTGSFTGKLKEGARKRREGGGPKESLMPYTDDMLRFFDRNGSFELEEQQVDLYIAKNKGSLQGISDSQSTLRGIKALQRVFKLNPTHRAVEALLDRGIDSAQKVYYMGREQFEREMADSGVNSIEAKKIYYRSEMVYAMTLNLFGTYNAELNGVLPYSTPLPNPDEQELIVERALIAPKIGKKTVTSKAATALDIPTLKTLFGSNDYCACTHCRSVYSPSAYFVDIMQFLKARKTNGTGVNISKNISQVLLGRRPDIGDIELSCENTNTPVPYVDLVNELLEDSISSPQPRVINNITATDLVTGTIKPGLMNTLKTQNVAINADAQIYGPDINGRYKIRDSRRSYNLQYGSPSYLHVSKQTFFSAEEARAVPEYTNVAAYNSLAKSIYPFLCTSELRRSR